MNQNERVELIANALISEVSRAYFASQGEKSWDTLMQMSLSELPQEFKQFCSARFQGNAAGKNVFGVVGTGVKFIRELKIVEKQLLQMIGWAGSLAGDKVDAATREELKRYALCNIKFSAAIQAVTEDLLIEKGL